MTTIDVGDRVNVRYFALAAGVPSTATVALVVTAPDGTTSSPSITHTAPNQYDAAFTASQAGVWYWTWTASGNVVDSESDQITAVAPGPPLYAPLALLRKACNITATDTTRDDLLLLALGGASRSVEEYCEGRVFNLAAAESARVFGLGRNVICGAVGERIPVDDIGSDDDLTVELSTDRTTWTALTTFETYPDNALAKRAAITAILSPTTSLRSYRWMRVTARWGWPEIPTAVQQATLLQAARLYKRKDSPEGVAGSSEWGLVRVPNLDPDVKALLAYLTTPFKAA